MQKRESDIPTNGTRQSILDAAGRLMTGKGVKETSLADIAREVGISKGTLYYYYSSKEDMIFDIVDIHLNRMTEEILSGIQSIVGDAAPNEILGAAFERIIGAEMRGKLHLYLIGIAVVGNDPIKKRFITRYQEWQVALEGVVRMILKDRKANYELLSHMLLAVLDGLIIQRMLGVEHLPLADMVELLTSVE